MSLEKSATVLTYKVPADYGGYADVFPNKVDKSAVNTPVDLSKAQALTKKYGDKIRIYPAPWNFATAKTTPSNPAPSAS